MIIGGLLVGVVGILVIVLPLSFASLEYHEFGFKRQKSTGKVDTSTVYSGGKYLVGPDVEFKRFKADAHFLDLDKVAIFTFDKLEVKISAHMQYFLRKDELPLLHAAYDLYYQDVMKTTAVDALKGAIPRYNTKELTLNRPEVENAIYNSVAQRLGGLCCRKDCSEYMLACAPDCIPHANCPDTKKGLHVNVKFFQLTNIIIPPDVEDRYMETLVLQEKNLREQLYQNAAIIRKETSKMVKDIENNATEIVQTATAQSQSISTKAKANYTNTIERARSSGLKKLYTDLGITDQAKKNSFDYLRTLNGLENAHITVDFQQRIAGTL